MRYLRYFVLGFIAVGLVIVALANRGNVILNLIPELLGDLIGFNVQVRVPLFIVIFLGVGAGLLIGFVWEWLREMKHRNAAKSEHRQVVRLEREVTKLKTETVKEQDDILAILDGGS
jgi:putative membrane protein|tara:strand:+ start:151 stop:501 length:351 start_codon:yes stop_codon:yes gene_type:complete